MVRAKFKHANLILKEDGYWLELKPLGEDLPALRRWLHVGWKGLQQLTVGSYRKSAVWTPTGMPGSCWTSSPRP